ncbi:hypothetical protein ILUMI_20933 [Ignelater luminosus]|uniref:HAT C-terminal dimerisation domain-containing protein n=1 Tax=Ignelater luminosus TaxID=2038154 RepID=A0A8K0G439_IGNLU|nr:hypothetical protein ILUMI_20933 [Ignelater luminosus]
MFKEEKQGRKLSCVMKEFLVQKSCLDEPSTSTSTLTALDLANKNSNARKLLYTSLQSILLVKNESDINANDLQEELRDASQMLPYSMKPLDVLNYLCQNNLITLYLNTVVALRILLTLPVSVAGGERSFSKLKLIEQYLRSSISQTKLRNLSLISIESTLAATLEYTSLINKFAKVKVRRVKL